MVKGQYWIKQTLKVIRDKLKIEVQELLNETQLLFDSLMQKYFKEIIVINFEFIQIYNFLNIKKKGEFYE